MPDRRGIVLANSFTVDEVRVLLELHAAVLRGDQATVRHLAMDNDLLKLIGKFQRMRTKHEAGA